MRLRFAVLLVCVAFFRAVAAVADAAPDLDALRAERDEEIARHFVRELTQKKLNSAVELLEAGEYAQARKKLEEFKFSRLNRYESALAYRFLAYAAIGQEDPVAAVDYFQKAVDQAALPIDDESSVRFSIAQIHASMEQWEEVEQALQEWFLYVDEPNSVAYYLLGISHYRRGEIDEALPPALEAHELADKPKESWLQLVAALYLERENFDKAVPILEELVVRFPNKRYWVQLSLIYGASGDYDDALRIQQLAHSQGLLTEPDELRRLVRTYLFRELPYPAAVVLESAIDEGRIEADQEMLELLGNAWIAAREYEKAIVPLERAAELSEDGKLYLRLGQVRVQREDWEQATELIQKAIRKGGLEDDGKAHLLLGISYYSDDHPDSARVAFQRARSHETTRTEASAWLDYIERQGHGG